MSKQILDELEELELRGSITSPDGDGAVGYVTLGTEALSAINQLINRKVVEAIEKTVDYIYVNKIHIDFMNKDDVVKALQTTSEEK